MPYTDFHWITEQIAVGANVYQRDDLPFDAIISMATHAALPLGELMRSGEIEYQWFPLVDDFCDGANDEIVQAFEDAAAAIDQAVRADQRVLVHCMGGVSRSATAVIWYLIRYQGYAWEDAARLLREKRPVTNPDISFELPLRLLGDEPPDEEWVARRIEEYVEDYRARGRSDRGRNLDTEFVQAALVRQGTLREAVYK
jgi:hypothetical protein